MRKMLIACAGVALLATMAHAGGKGKKEKAERPSAEQVQALQSIQLTYEVKDGNLHLSWTPATGETSGGVKVVYSAENDSPLYPFEPYAAWLPGSGKNECVIPNKKAAGEARFYRVCSVMPKNHRELIAVSNVIQVPAIEKTGKGDAGKDAKVKEKGKGEKKEEAEKPDTGALYCAQCGAKVKKDDNFCRKCGAALKEKKEK